MANKEKQNVISDFTYKLYKELKDMEIETELRIQEKQQKFESELSAKNLKKYLIDQTEKLYQKLRLNEVKV